MIEVQILSPDEWKPMSVSAHTAVFGETRLDLDCIDFTILCVQDGIPLTFATCRLIDSETIYLQYGGSFPSAIGTTLSWRCYEATLDKVKETYKRITTLVENTNTPMLKFAMKYGLRISGVRYFKGSILLEHGVEFE